MGAANTPFAHYLGVDFELIHTETVIDEPYFSEFKRGALAEDNLRRLIRSQFNIVRELRMTLRTRKSALPAG